MDEVQTLANFPLELDAEKLVEERPQLAGAQEKLRELQKYIQPVAFWRELKVDGQEQNRISLEEGKLIIDSAYVALGLAGCSKATLLAVTIGQELPHYAQDCLQKGKLWEGTVADILGSEAVEIMAEKIHSYLKGIFLPKGLFSTLRFSPGYGDWSLKDQEKILEILQTKPKIKVTENYLLEPVKSITALIGWSSMPVSQEYPQGEKKKGFCAGGQNCAYCTTWACRK